MIYAYVLCDGSDIEVSPDNTKWLPPPITKTCLEIRYETLRLFYVVNTFKMTIHNSDVGFAMGAEKLGLATDPVYWKTSSCPHWNQAPC